MRLTAETADRIAEAYGSQEVERALFEVMRRSGGLLEVLTPGARHDLILTLGERRRAARRPLRFPSGASAAAAAE